MNENNCDSELVNIEELTPQKLIHADANLHIDRNIVEELMYDNITNMSENVIYRSIQCINRVVDSKKYVESVGKTTIPSRIDPMMRDAIIISFNVSEDDPLIRTLVDELRRFYIRYTEYIKHRSLKDFEKYLRSFISNDMKTIWSMYMRGSKIYILGAEYFASSNESPSDTPVIGDVVARIHVPTAIFNIAREENASENINFIIYSYNDIYEKDSEHEA